MKIARIKIKNFRCIRSAEMLPSMNNVLLGPNNIGKTTILEAINYVLNPEITYRSNMIDENDFFGRQYYQIETEGDASNTADHDNDGDGDAEHTEVSEAAGDNPYNIYIEIVITDLTDDDKDKFGDDLVPWDSENSTVIEETEEGTDPFQNAAPAIRVFFEGWYDSEEDDFFFNTFFLKTQGLRRDDCRKFNRSHKRHIGFLIYRNFRGLTRPITLEPATLFGLLLRSQEVQPKNFEKILDQIEGDLSPMSQEPEFQSIVNSYKAELERFLPLSYGDSSSVDFELTDRTRRQIKSIAQLYVNGETKLPFEKMGAGTRSLAILSMLTLIMRRRQRGILALEEPETFLFPHAQRRVMDECIGLSDQLFVTTHSPYVLERIPVDGVGRIDRDSEDKLVWSQISVERVKDINLYSKRFKQVHCEALVGRAVVISEGDSDRAWIMGAARIMDRQEWNGHKQEAFELQGIGIVSAEGHGDICKLGRFFNEAGLKVIGLFDRISDQNAVNDICECPFPSLFLPYDGIEDLLANRLPLNVLRQFVVRAPHCKTPLKTATELGAMSDQEIRIFTKQTLIDNKGSIQMHEWLISITDFASLPSILKTIIDEVSEYTRGNTDFTSHSLRNVS